MSNVISRIEMQSKMLEETTAHLDQFSRMIEPCASAATDHHKYKLYGLIHAMKRNMEDLRKEEQ